MQSDPIGLAGGLNTYLYANANSLIYVDFWGLDSNPAPSWNPSYWDGDLGQRNTSTNCYGYARNRPGSHRNPGDASYLLPPTCKDMIEGAKADGMIDPSGTGSCGGDCPEGYHKVQVFIESSFVNRDFHWYRQDSDGGWSSKPGSRRPRRGSGAMGSAMSCPSSQSQDFSPYNGNNYSEFCGTLCAPN